MANWKKVGTGALTAGATGAASGAIAGSAVPVIGTAIGAGIGGLGGLVAGSIPGLFEKSEKAKQRDYLKKQRKAMAGNSSRFAPDTANGELPTSRTGNAWSGYDPYTQYNSTLSPEQRASQNSLLPDVTNRLSKTPNFEDIRNETIRHYKENILPGINNNFTASTGGKSSSPVLGLQRAEGDRSLLTQLNSQRYQHELEQQRLNQNLYGTLMNKSIEPHYYEGVEGFGPKLTNDLIEQGVPHVIDLFKKLVKSSPKDKVNIEKELQKYSPAVQQRAREEMQLIKSGKPSAMGQRAVQGYKNQQASDARWQAVGDASAAIAEVGIKALAKYYLGGA